MIDLDIDDKHENIELKDKHTLLEELQYTGSNSSSVKSENIGTYFEFRLNCPWSWQKEPRNLSRPRNEMREDLIF